MVLIALICFLVLLVIYLATHYTRQNTVRGAWAFLPSHFTIPILSPFTSVVSRSMFPQTTLSNSSATPQVEHETSVVGSKTITMICLALTGLAYLIFRHRLSRAFG